LVENLERAGDYVVVNYRRAGRRPTRPAPTFTAWCILLPIPIPFSSRHGRKPFQGVGLMPIVTLIRGSATFDTNRESWVIGVQPNFLRPLRKGCLNLLKLRPEMMTTTLIHAKNVCSVLAPQGSSIPKIQIVETTFAYPDVRCYAPGSSLWSTS